jgi:hypothetical protein
MRIWFKQFVFLVIAFSGNTFGQPNTASGSVRNVDGYAICEKCKPPIFVAQKQSVSIHIDADGNVSMIVEKPTQSLLEALGSKLNLTLPKMEAGTSVFNNLVSAKWGKIPKWLQGTTWLCTQKGEGLNQGLYICRR